MIDIKLDNCGGLTEALMMVAEARSLGKQVMVGNMAGSRLATAPAFVLGKVCDIVDLDGPYFLADDPVGAGLYGVGGSWFRRISGVRSGARRGEPCTPS